MPVVTSEPSAPEVFFSPNCQTPPHASTFACDDQQATDWPTNQGRPIQTVPISDADNDEEQKTKQRRNPDEIILPGLLGRRWPYASIGSGNRVNQKCVQDREQQKR